MPTPTKNSTAHTSVNDYVRGFICDIDHFVSYIEDAMWGPDLADFDVIRAKIEQIRNHMTFMEQVIGIRRKEHYESRPQGATRGPQATVRRTQSSEPHRDAAARASTRHRRDTGKGTRRTEEHSNPRLSNQRRTR